MKYNYEYVVRYQDVDDTRRLRLNKLEEYLLDVAGRVANSLNFGTSYLLEQNLTWVLTHLSVEIDALPIHDEVLRFETWIESNAHMLSTRDFRIYRKPLSRPDGHPSPIIEEGANAQEWELIGQAKSVWAVLDLTKREIVNIFDQPIFADSVDGERLDIARAARPMPIAEPSGIMPYKIRYSDLDYNCHCNSCQYLEIMLDAARMDTRGKKIRLDLNYVKEIGEGAEVEVAYLKGEDNIFYQMRDVDGKTNVFARVSVKE